MDSEFYENLNERLKTSRPSDEARKDKQMDIFNKNEWGGHLTKEQDAIVCEAINRVGAGTSCWYNELARLLIALDEALLAIKPDTYPVYDVQFSGSNDCMCAMWVSIAAKDAEEAKKRAEYLSSHRGWTLGRPITEPRFNTYKRAVREDWYGDIYH